MKRLAFNIFALWLCSGFVSHAAAEGLPYYGGIDVFATSAELISEKDLIDVTTRFVTQNDSNDTLESQRRLSFEDAGHGKRIYMGISSAEDWDWEWGYVDFGKVHGRYEGPSASHTVDTKADAKAEGWFLHVQYTPHLFWRFEGNLKLGVLRWDGSRYWRMTITEPNEFPVERFETVSGIDEYFGAGLIFNVNERWKIRFDANRYILADDQLDTFGVAAQFWFSGRLINNVFDY